MFPLHGELRRAASCQDLDTAVLRLRVHWVSFSTYKQGNQIKIGGEARRSCRKEDLRRKENTGANGKVERKVDFSVRNSDTLLKYTGKYPGEGSRGQGRRSSVCL